MFVSGCAYTMANDKGPQRRNAEADLERPEPSPRKD